MHCGSIAHGNWFYFKHWKSNCQELQVLLCNVYLSGPIPNIAFFLKQNIQNVIIISFLYYSHLTFYARFIIDFKTFLLCVQQD